MAEELILTAVQPAIDQNLNPIFDYSPLWGWPLWVFIFIAFGIILIAINLKWFRRRMVMAPVLEYLWAFKSGLQEDMQTWMFGKNKSFFIKHLRYHNDGVISYHNFLQKISMWYLSSPLAVGHAGGIKSVIVSDNIDTVRDFIAEVALCTAIDEFNSKNPIPMLGEKGEILVDEHGQQLMKNPITSYKEYEKYRPEMQKMFPTGVPVNVYCHFNPLKAEQFFPRNRTSGMFGADCIREARKKNIEQKEESAWLKFAPLGIALVVVIIGILFTFYATGG